MAKNKTKDRMSELRLLGDAELDVAAEAARRSTYSLLRQRISKPIENIKQFRTNRKDVARILTIKRERQIAASKQAEK